MDTASAGRRCSTVQEVAVAAVGARRSTAMAALGLLLAVLATLAVVVGPARPAAADSGGNCNGNWTGNCAPLRPILDCVFVNANGSRTASFGYTNTVGQPLDIPVGWLNRFTPGAADRGQPTTFAAGRVYGAVLVPYTGSLTWQLAGVSATATTSSPTCPQTAVPMVTKNLPATGLAVGLLGLGLLLAVRTGRLSWVRRVLEPGGPR